MVQFMGMVSTVDVAVWLAGWLGLWLTAPLASQDILIHQKAWFAESAIPPSYCERGRLALSDFPECLGLKLLQQLEKERQLIRHGGPEKIQERRRDL